MTVVGVVEKMTGSPTRALTGFYNFYDHALLIPYRRAALQLYVVRAKPGRLDTTMHEAERQLRAANPLRVISQVRPFIEDRREGLRTNRSLALLFSAVCFMLLAITALGIVGVTTFWISQRGHQDRDASGARGATSSHSPVLPDGESAGRRPGRGDRRGAGGRAEHPG